MLCDQEEMIVRFNNVNRTFIGRRTQYDARTKQKNADNTKILNNNRNFLSNFYPFSSSLLMMIHRHIDGEPELTRLPGTVAGVTMLTQLLVLRSQNLTVLSCDPLTNIAPPQL